MWIKTKNIFKIASVFIGTVIGAGFASGQEMLQFFSIYNEKGFLGLVLSGVLFFLIGWAVLDLVYNLKVNGFKQFIYRIAGKRPGTIIEYSASFFMFICYCAMLAGSGALLKQKFDIPYCIGVVIMAIGCYATFIFGVKGLVAINAILAPILIIGCAILGIYIYFEDSNVFNNMSSIYNQIRYNWFSSSILYVSYNIITAIVVLTTLKKYVTSKLESFFGALISGIGLGLLGIIIGSAISKNYNVIKNVEIPMLTIVMRYVYIIELIYIIVIIAAMFTTAVSNGYGIISSFKDIKKASLLVTLTGILFAQIGFSKMVAFIYPLFGYIGLYEIILIMVYYIKYKLTLHR